MARILVIDDSALMRNILRGALAEEGHETDAFLPESEAGLIEKLRNYAPDLLITDFNMPILDGKAVVRICRFVVPAAKIVLLTASREPARDSLLQTMGVRRILYKPIRAEEVVASVQKVLQVG